MRILLVLSILLASLTAHARPARPREVKVTITLREQVAVRAWLEGVTETKPEALRDLVSVYDDLRLADARTWVDSLPPEKAKATTIDKVPEAPKREVSLGQSEAKALMQWLAPSEKRPQDAALGRVLLGFSDAVEDALATRK